MDVVQQYVDHVNRGDFKLAEKLLDHNCMVVFLDMMMHRGSEAIEKNLKRTCDPSIIWLKRLFVLCNL